MIYNPLLMKNSDSSLKNILEFIPSRNYVDNLERELSDPFNKVTFYYFKVVAAKPFLRIASKLFEALKKGKEINLQLDPIYSTKNISGDGFYYPLTAKSKQKNQKAVQKNLSLFKKLEKAGAKITYSNEPNFLLTLVPFVKRDHRKVVIIERMYGSVVYFGATNFTNKEASDFMIKVNDHRIAEKIAEISTPEFIQSQKHDFILEISENLKFFIDIGKNFRSKIQNHAYRMLDRAKSEVVFVSQLPAEFPLIIRFVLARINGAKVKLLLPPFKNKDLSGFPFIFFYWMNLFFAKLFGFEIAHSRSKYLHSKILICDNSVLLGSHNLSSAGVWFGTVEFSAFVKDESFINKVKDYINLLEGIKDEKKNLINKDFLYKVQDPNQKSKKL